MRTISSAAPVPPPRRWPGALLIVAGTGAAYAAAVLIGRGQEARGERILSVFDPFFLALRGPGAGATDWLEGHVAVVAGSVTLLLALLALAGSWGAGRRRAGPLLTACGATGLAVWGQSLLLWDHVALGRALYLAGVGAAFVLGWWQPMRRLPGFPAFGAEAGAGERDTWQPSWPTECWLVLGIALLSLACRAWALTELSDFLDLEMVDSMVQGRTLHGVAEYARETFLTTNPGFAHMLPLWAIYRLFGASVFTLRMAAVLWGVAAVPMMYWVVRRLGGPKPALLAALFMATAPDQLFWSRSENGFFSPVPMLALVTVNVGLWMVERFSLASVLSAAVCMPLSRYFYTTCLAMFLFPLGVMAHATLFVRGAWRKLWFVVPILAVGLVVWWFHLTVLLAALNDWQWRFRHPADIYGGPAWTRQGDFANVSLVELARGQATSMAGQLKDVARDLTYQAQNRFGHWYSRSQPNPHPTTLNVGLVLLAALGVGYLAGQLRDPRAFALLWWLCIALLPGIMSRDAAPRRMSMLFLVAHVIAALFVAALVRLARQSGGHRGASVATATAGAALAVVIGTNAVSHFRLPLQPAIFTDHLRFVRPFLEGSDAWFFNLPHAFRSFVMLGHLEHFLTSPGCFQFVETHIDWLKLGLAPHCTFADEAYNLILTEAERRAVQERYQMHRASFVFFVDPATRKDLGLVRALYPDAAHAEYTSPRDGRHLAAVTVDVAESLALRTPDLRLADPPDAPPALLADVPVRMIAEPDAAGPSSAVVAGGILLDSDGWYRFGLQAPCPGAELRVAGQVPGDQPTPLLAGVHPFTVRVPDWTQCGGPMRILSTSAPATALAPVPPERITSVRVAALAEAVAPVVQAYPGYAPPAMLGRPPVRPGDLQVGPDGSLFVAGFADGRWLMYRLAPSGAVLANWDMRAPQNINLSTFAVADDGTVAAVFARTLRLYGPDGQDLGAWENVWLSFESQLAWWGPHVVTSIPHRNSLAVFDRHGELQSEFSAFATERGPQELYQPRGFSLTRDGDLIVLQENGRAVRFHTPTDRFQPSFVRDFAIEAASQGVAFDGAQRILMPAAGRVQVFDGDGTRLMADNPDRDPGHHPFGGELRLRSGADGVYLLEIEGQRLWKIPH